MEPVECIYIAAGGNRHPSAADWAPGLLAFGAGKNVALWNPNDASKEGIHALLKGHDDVVNAVKIYDSPNQRLLLTGAADKTIRIWRQIPKTSRFELAQCLTEHQGSVNTISILPDRQLFVSGAADGTVKIWSLVGDKAKLIQSIPLWPEYIPLTTSITELEDNGILVLAVAGTSNAIQLYASSKPEPVFDLQTTLSGHEGWIRSLDFVHQSDGPSAGVLLASASQDKYIRLWRFARSASAPTNGASSATQKRSIANKAHQIVSATCAYNVSFEALLVGHEDWILNVQWAPLSNQTLTPRLLSASADNSLAIWEADPASGVWICQTRLGEISSQKGSTTATGSTGGFWIGMWSPDGGEVVNIDRTGSWRRWKHEPSSDSWLQQLGISGHTKDVKDTAWAADGSYLLSTSSDQTTRLFSEWKHESGSSWHELSRPQIHGYDLTCIASVHQDRFVSGADEKLLRVFNKPRAVALLLASLHGAPVDEDLQLPDAANIPVLGLSNKAIPPDQDTVNGTNGPNGDHGEDANDKVERPSLAVDHPPFEQQLARSTLWPEQEKLYGHGFEISAVAASHDGSLIATACKASSLDHAVIRIYETGQWREIKPPLSAHNLTVTALAFSHDDHYLLSVGRDRRWTLFARTAGDSKVYSLAASNPKAHSRMVLDCSWAPNSHMFATASRDKSVKVWTRTTGEGLECVRTINANAAVTAVAFDTMLYGDELRLAYGTEEGELTLVILSAESTGSAGNCTIPSRFLPSAAINAIRWRPSAGSNAASGNEVAVASDDYSLRVFRA